MGAPKPAKRKKRFIGSWATSLISITLVLVLLGMLALVLVNARKLANYAREQIGFTLILHEEVKEVEIIRLQKVLATSNYIKSVRYIDKETAAGELSEQLGEDFIGFLGFNPLFASLDIKLFAAYTHNDSLEDIEQKLMAYPQVAEVAYQKNLATLINKNVKKISFILLLTSSLFAFIFFGLINNTIRLLIYSQRFTINTMQMVGAANGYIRWPFLRNSIVLGLGGALIANIVLAVFSYVFLQQFRGVLVFSNAWLLPGVAGIIFILGTGIALLSAWLALNKFLRLKFDELFY